MEKEQQSLVSLRVATPEGTGRVVATFANQEVCVRLDSGRGVLLNRTQLVTLDRTSPRSGHVRR